VAAHLRALALLIPRIDDHAQPRPGIWPKE
jgi:hypothetical protein